MKFLDKLKSVGTAITETTQDLTKTYKEKGFDGIVDKAEKGINVLNAQTDKLAEKSTAYVRDIYEDNKKLVKDIKSDESLKDSSKIDKTISVSVAATLHTSQRLKDDLVKVGKNLYKEWVIDENAVENVGVTSEDRKVQKSSKSDVVDSRYESLDKISLKDLFKSLRIKKVRGKDEYKDEQNNTFLIDEDKWHYNEKSISGSGAVSFMALHLSTITQSDYHNEATKKILVEQSLDILTQFQNKEKEIPVTKPTRKVAKKGP